MDSNLAWLEQFDGNITPDAPLRAAILVTSDAEGWPHVAYLSMGEVLAHARGISIALWPNSRTSSNIARDGRAVLHAAAQNSVWEARLSLKQRAVQGPGDLAIFDGDILTTRRHTAPYADVLDLIVFRLHDTPATLDRWTTQIRRLRETPP
jgi:hypothetical protein